MLVAGLEAVKKGVAGKKRWLPGDKRTERAQVGTASAIFTNRSDKQKRKLRDDLMELNPRAPRLEVDTFIRPLAVPIL